MLASGFVYEVDQVGAIRVVPDLDKKAGCYYAQAEWRAKQEAKTRRVALLGRGWGTAFPNSVSLRVGRSWDYGGNHYTWAAVVNAYEKRGDIARAVWFDADLRPTVFRVQDGKVEILMTPEECLAAAIQRMEGE
jgi:hypothetical protein